MRRTGIVAAAAIAGALAVNALGGFAVADHQPANKAAVAASNLEVMKAQAEEGSGSEAVTLFATQIRTSDKADLVMEVTAECALVTDIVNLGNSDSESVAQVKIWAEVDGQPVSIGRGVDADTVVFCNRAFRKVITDLDDEDAQFETFLRTRAAHAFNWIALNVPSGIHDIEIKSRLEVTVTGVGNAEALIGKRTLVVDPIRLPHDATL